MIGAPSIKVRSQCPLFHLSECDADTSGLLHWVEGGQSRSE